MQQRTPIVFDHQKNDIEGARQWLVERLVETVQWQMDNELSRSSHPEKLLEKSVHRAG